MSEYNDYFKRVRISHEMSRSDVVQCCALGGLEITGSRSEGWARGIADERRFIEMHKDEFEAFTIGLIAWSREE